MGQNFIEKLRNKTISDLFKSVWCRFEYTFINPIKPYVIRFLYFIFRFLPIDKNLIIFESERDYCDNSWALYQYIKSNYNNYHFVWATLKRKKYNDDPRTKFVYHPYKFSFLSAWYIGRARFIFYTHGLGADLKKRKGQLILNLWHGSPFKGIKGGVNLKEPLFDYLIYLGDRNKKATAKFLCCDESYLVKLGYPRFDLMLNNKGYGYENEFVPKGFRGKTIIWMPTFRKSINKNLSEDCETETGLPLMKNEDDLLNLNAFLKEKNVIIILKIHHLQAEELIFKQSFSNLLFVNDDMLTLRDIQLYQILGKTDALISDYSSIAIDYLLMDRPMGFILNDEEEYASHRGEFLYEDIREILAGSYIYSIEDLKKFISDVAAGIDTTKPLRDKLLPQMISYPDNQNCKRICEFCGL